MNWQTAIWLVLVLVASAGLLMGVLALTNRIEAIDERLSELRSLELELARTFKWAVASHTSELNAIKRRLDQLSTQTSDLGREDNAELIALAQSGQTTVPHSENG